MPKEKKTWEQETRKDVRKAQAQPCETLHCEPMVDPLVAGIKGEKAHRGKLTGEKAPAKGVSCCGAAGAFHI